MLGLSLVFWGLFCFFLPRTKAEISFLGKSCFHPLCEYQKHFLWRQSLNKQSQKQGDQLHSGAVTALLKHSHTHPPDCGSSGRFSRQSLQQEKGDPWSGYNTCHKLQNKQIDTWNPIPPSQEGNRSYSQVFLWIPLSRCNFFSFCARKWRVEFITPRGIGWHVGLARKNKCVYQRRGRTAIQAKLSAMVDQDFSTFCQRQKGCVLNDNNETLVSPCFSGFFWMEVLGTGRKLH